MIPEKNEVISEKQYHKYEIAKALLKENIKQTEIAKLLNYTPEHLSRIKPKILKNPLVTKKLIKTAVNSVKHFADVKNYENDERIKPSDTLRASEIILDRAFPKTQVIENHTVNHNLIDLSSYQIDVNVKNPDSMNNQTPQYIDISNQHMVVENDQEDKSLIDKAD